VGIGRTNDGSGVGPLGLAGTVAVGIALIEDAAGLARPAGGGTHAAATRMPARSAIDANVRGAMSVIVTVVDPAR
jgi:hypothetical protein